MLTTAIVWLLLPIPSPRGQSKELTVGTSRTVVIELRAGEQRTGNRE